MVGIESFGVHIPLWRLDVGVVGGSGERAVANFDEDSLTMGVAAGIDCLNGIDRNTIDGLFFASTTSPYREKQISVTAASALDLREDVLTVDFANSLRSGSTALIMAMNAVKAGSAKKIMVIAADMRVPMPGSQFEQLFGDGAAAFIVSDEATKATVEDSYSVSDEMLDVWRTDQDRYVRSWEERFAVEEGYFRVLPRAVSAVMERNKLKAGDVRMVAFNGPDGRRHQEMARRLGFSKTQVQEPMFGLVGDTGSAFSLMLLAGALERAKVGERVLLAGYGSGADVLLLRSTGEFRVRRGVKQYLESRKVLRDYKTYLGWRELLEMTSGRRRPPNPVPAASAIWRERDQNIRLHGVRCLNCGMVQYPPQRVCAGCHTKDRFEAYRLSDKKARLFTYAVDNATPTGDPPLVLAVVNFEGGGRMWVYMTDKDTSELAMDMPVEMTFRKLFTMEGIHNYFWKCMPARIKQEGQNGKH